MKYLFVCLKAAEPFTLIRGHCLWHLGCALLHDTTFGRRGTLLLAFERGLARDCCAGGGRRFLCSWHDFHLSARLWLQTQQYPGQCPVALFCDGSHLCLLLQHCLVSDASKQVRRQGHSTGCEIVFSFSPCPSDRQAQGFFRQRDSASGILLSAAWMVRKFMPKSSIPRTR